MARAVGCDVLVVGGGNAALCAAITAREHGADVLLLERAERAWRGGNSKYTRNVRCAKLADTAEQSYPEREFLDDLRAVSGPPPNPELTSLLIESSISTPEWMESQGIRWQPALNGTLSLSRTNWFYLGGGKALMNVYYLRAERLGVRIAYEASATALRFSDGGCSEVEVEAAEGGERYLVRPGAVVIASGGFEANRGWLRDYWGKAADNVMIRGARQNDGLMLKELLSAGAKPCGDVRGLHAIAVDARGPAHEGGIATRVDAIPLSVVVNRNGRRFYDEGEELWPKRYATWGRLILGQPDQIVYSIFDRKSIGKFMATMFPPFEAGTLEELARLCELDPVALRQTIGDYNASVVPGTFDPQVLDDCHTKGLPLPKSHWALRIEHPPYYAYPLRPGITFTYLGVEVDRHARVARRDGGGFGNVFAAGEVMAGNILMRGYLAGIGMTIGTVFGRIAGRQAAGLVRG
jgi:tricarballylate dehydrogenase